MGTTRCNASLQPTHGGGMMSSGRRSPRRDDQLADDAVASLKREMEEFDLSANREGMVQLQLNQQQRAVRDHHSITATDPTSAQSPRPQKTSLLSPRPSPILTFRPSPMASPRGDSSSSSVVTEPPPPEGASFVPAQRFKELLGEAAYAVQAEAEALQATGKAVYKFHIGDLGFKSPSQAIFGCHQAMLEGRTGYCSSAGIKPLRSAVAKRIGTQRGVKYAFDNVSIQPGGKPLIYKFLLTVVEAGEEVLYPSPGYPAYESMINYFGAVGKPYCYKETEKGFCIDLDYLESLITSKTKALIVNSPHNPTGALSTKEEFESLSVLCERHNLWVLSDEPYVDLMYNRADHPIRSIASIPGMQERTVILFCFSKSFAMTGWRLGAAIGPKSLIKQINALNNNFEGCTSQPQQWGAYELMSDSKTCEEFVSNLLEEMRRRRDLITPLLNTIPGFRCREPEGSFYCYANVTYAMKVTKCSDIESFRKHVLQQSGVSFCHRNHFGRSQPFDKNEFYVRFSFGNADEKAIRHGCEELRTLMTEAFNVYNEEMHALGLPGLSLNCAIEAVPGSPSSFPPLQDEDGLHASQAECSSDQGHVDNSLEKLKAFAKNHALSSLSDCSTALSASGECF